MGRRIDRYQALAEAHDFPIPIGKSFGMFISAVSEGQGVMEMDVRPEFLNSQGYVQGGILASLADAAMGVAFGSVLNEEDIMTSIEFKLNLIAPIFQGKIIAVGNLIHHGTRTAVTECDVFDDHQNLIAKAIGTLILI